MTPTERIQIISELRRTFPAHKRLQEALADYEALAIEAGRRAASKPSVKSRAAYMREHRRKERELIREARERRSAETGAAQD